MGAVLEIAELLEPLNAVDSRAFIRAQVGKDSARSPAELLHPILFSSDFERGEYDLPEIPRTVEALAAVLDELPVTAAQMVPFLVQTCTTDLAYPGTARGPWSIETAQAVLGSVVQAIGPRTRWWTNVHYSTWCWTHGDFSDSFTSNPVTGHDFDRAVIGIGTDVTITLLAFADS